ncbi:hypothetical protein GM160_10440 [Guyparkeria halophila]|uniref:Uncharacterized protein n=1 Tax=Guyparkeria halophila TaxID=47960 RepID=A0A6I6DBY3_9GAMM|nr:MULTISPECIES: hypothetical protein [Guyparkeria]QGT79272.1 hypothetical protein GM160_10440 [Guyparkeria halophila]TKA89002.1 hypothetical protein FAZ79_07460 [Guyparkeria sp. SB14A]
MQSAGTTLTCTVALAISAGCGLQNIDKPSPSEYERWSKSGTPTPQTKQDLKVCGYRDATWTIEQQISVDKCMLGKGYSFIDPVRGMSQCDYKPYQILPSCQSLDK